MVLGALLKEKARRRGFLEGWAKESGQSPTHPNSSAAYEALSEWLEPRALADGYSMPSSARARSEGKAAGKSEADKAWRAWLSRRAVAEANGELFNELPPDGKPLT
jgi:hypothetical protein